AVFQKFEEWPPSERTGRPGPGEAPTAPRVVPGHEYSLAGVRGKSPRARGLREPARDADRLTAGRRCSPAVVRRHGRGNCGPDGYGSYHLVMAGSSIKPPETTF